MDTPIEKRRFGKSKLITVGLVVTIVFGLVYLVLAANSSVYALEKSTANIGEVTVGQFQEIIPASGTVEPLKSIMVNAIEGGRVEAVLAENGAMVK
ncbi:MAG: efflux transporter periplasmic adaptor subunit, partial [Bacteroidetes bacterium]|nr:efflux transporter periplasmic adaptor subunit [Bacteroidota bacterium]